MMMRRLLFIALIAITFSCENDPGYVIEGTIDNAVEGQKIFVAELNENNNQTTVIDTMVVSEGKFYSDLPEKEKPTLSFLTVEGARGNVLFVADNEPINFKIYRDSLFASEVTGGRDNEILYDYFEEVKEWNKTVTENRSAMMQAFRSEDTIELEKLQREQEDLTAQNLESKKELIKEHPNSMISVMVLQELAGSNMVPTAELQELYNSLDSEVKNTFLGKQLGETISNRSMVDIGSKAPNFSAPTPEGEELALHDVLGKVTLVDFWASWCKPCRDENPNIVNVYNKYHDQGFNVLGVSLDRPGQKDQWEKAIADDNLEWNQVSNLLFWQDPIAKQYGVQAIPAAFLLDENGVIVARDLRGEDLEKQVANMLSQG